MKKIIFLTVLAFSFMLMIQSCQPDDDFSIGQPANRIEQLAGTWKLQSVTQIDLLAQSNNFNDQARPDIDLIKQDVTSAAPFTDMTITFAQSSGTPSTFTVNYGNAPRIFVHAGGNWSVDNILAPGNINLVNGTDTVKTKLGAVNTLAAGNLILSKIRYQGNKPVLQYNYNFTKN
jgi:hypothetical protein